MTRPTFHYFAYTFFFSSIDFPQIRLKIRENVPALTGPAFHNFGKGLTSKNEYSLEVFVANKNLCFSSNILQIENQNRYGQDLCMDKLVFDYPRQVAQSGIENPAILKFWRVTLLFFNRSSLN